MVLIGGYDLYYRMHNSLQGRGGGHSKRGGSLSGENSFHTYILKRWAGHILQSASTHLLSAGAMVKLSR